MVKNIIILGLILILGFTGSKSQNQRWRKGIVEETFIYEEAGSEYPSCHAATIAETPAGLVTAWFGGQHERHPEVCIYVSRLVNQQWTAPQKVADGIVNDTLRYACWNPVLYQVPNGKLILFYKVGPNVAGWVGKVKESTDNGVTWSEAKDLPESYLGPIKNKPVLLSNGQLYCPASTEGGKWRVHFEITEDFGETWTKTDPINEGKVYSVIQPSILTYGDSTMQVLCRSKNAVLASSWSYDNGKTWGLMKSCGLPNNNSGTDAVTLKSGLQLLAYNHIATPINAKKGHRTPLNIAVSKDGKNWKAALVLEDSEISQYSYPSVIQSADGMVHVVYTWRRQLIKYVKIDPDKLKLSPIKDGEWPKN